MLVWGGGGGGFGSGTDLERTETKPKRDRNETKSKPNRNRIEKNDNRTNHNRSLDLCGSSVTFAPVRQVLVNCGRLRTLNLSSCRALPRGIKRLYDGVTQLTNLRAAIRAGRFDDAEAAEAAAAAAAASTDD